MTTIAIRDGIMAADTSVWEGCYRGSKQKIVRTSLGHLFATCGDSGITERLAKWIEDGESEDRLPRIVEKTDFAALVLYRDGSVGHYTERFMRSMIDGPFFALGSGNEFALGAMAMGASAEKAVEIACQFDPWSRGPVQVERLYL